MIRHVRTKSHMFHAFTDLVAFFPAPIGGGINSQERNLLADSCDISGFRPVQISCHCDFVHGRPLPLTKRATWSTPGRELGFFITNLAKRQPHQCDPTAPLESIGCFLSPDCNIVLCGGNVHLRSLCEAGPLLVGSGCFGMVSNRIDGFGLNVGQSNINQKHQRLQPVPG